MRIILLIAVALYAVLKAHAQTYDEIFHPVPDEEIVSTAHGHPITWTIGIAHCGEPVGVVFIQANGRPRWVPIALADKGDVSTTRRFVALRQFMHVDTCDGETK